MMMATTRTVLYFPVSWRQGGSTASYNSFIVPTVVSSLFSSGCVILLGTLILALVSRSTASGGSSSWREKIHQRKVYMLKRKREHKLLITSRSFLILKSSSRNTVQKWGWRKWFPVQLSHIHLLFHQDNVPWLMIFFILITFLLTICG